ncbi:MAG: efflux RND transporter permease subunit [candidate division NC10 bacterium]|nr:efflux RND transporter permease subunit [candidate division NC10 bacterium]
MLKKIVIYSLEHRVLILMLVGLAFAIGVGAFLSLSTDLLPDLSSPVITVIVENHGMAPQDIETLITRPLESALRSMPNVTRVRSHSGIEIATVTAEFKWGTDYYLARQWLAEKLATVSPLFPIGTEPPVIGSAQSRLSEVLEFYIEGPLSPRDQRELADYLIRYQLQTIPGVSKLLNFGGEIRQFQVLLDLDKLKGHGITVDQVAAALRENNQNFSGGIVVDGPLEFTVRGLGRLTRLSDLNQVVVATEHATPIYLRDVATIQEGGQIRRGIAMVGGREVVAVTVFKQYGLDTMPVIKDIKRVLEETRGYLPKGVALKIFFDQSALIQVAIRNLVEALLLGSVAVILIILFFLGSIRPTFIPSITIPVAVIITFIFMKLFHITINIMSLGGIAVVLGIMVDDSIVVTENIFRHLRIHHQDPYTATVEGSVEVRRPIIYTTFIIIAVFLPLLFLSGLEGKIFGPFAFTVVTSMLIGMVLSLTLTPVLCYLILAKVPPHQKEENWLTRTCQRLYGPILRFSLAHPKKVALASFGIFFITLSLIPFVGTELLPSIDEGAVMVQAVMPPGTSISEMAGVTHQVAQIMAKAPDMEVVVERAGRAEQAEHTHGVNVAEIHGQLVPFSQRKHSTQEVTDWIRQRTKNLPGVAVSFTQPLALRIEEAMAGVSAPLAIKIFGPDLDILRQKATEVESLIRSVRGVVDSRVQQTAGAPQITIQIDRAQASRYGLSVEKIKEVVETALEGRTATTVLRDQKEYRVFVRLEERFRDRIDKIGSLLIDTPTGARVPLGLVAQISNTVGPSDIPRENMVRLCQVFCSVSGRDMGSVVEEIKEKLKRVDFPRDYFVVFGGKYEKQEALMRQMMVVFGISALLVFMLLYMGFKSIRHALLIIFTIPLGLMGGILALLITRHTFNVSSLIGLVVHFGLSVQKGVILVDYLNHLRDQGMPMEQVTWEAGQVRMRPVLMTASCASLAVLPLAIGWGAGAEMQQPMAIVLIGGLITSTLLTLIILPSLYGLLERYRGAVGDWIRRPWSLLHRRKGDPSSDRLS